MKNTLVFGGKQTIFVDGFGMVSKQVMTNPNISLGAKALYSYLCTFANNENQAFPSRERILNQLNISKDTYYNYLNELKTMGYITITQERNDKGIYCKNIYTIELVPCPKIPDTEKEPCPKKPDTEKPDTENQDTNIQGSNKPFLNKSFLSKDELINYYKEQIGELNKYDLSYIDYWLEKVTINVFAQCIDEAVYVNIKNMDYIGELLIKKYVENKKGGDKK